MSYKAEQLLVLTTNFEKLAAKSLEKEADKKDKKKLDPKAEVRNRGTVCVPASSAKDKKDHFPINDEGQARNALARVHQYSSVPSWYSGSLKGLQDLVSRKVHSKYPSIGKDSKKKKSSEYYDTFLNKYGQAQPTWWERNNPLNTQHGPFSKERNQGLFGKPPAPPAAQPEPAPATGAQPPIVNNEGKVDWEEAQRQKDKETPPAAAQPAQPAAKPAAKPAAPKASGYTFVPEIQDYQKWIVGQGRGKELGPAGPDGKLGPKTMAALLRDFPNSNNDSDKAVQDWMAYKAKMGYGKKEAPPPQVPPNPYDKYDPGY